MKFNEICEAYRSRNSTLFRPASEALVDFYSDQLPNDRVAKLTSAIARSGEFVNLPADLGPFADVPSTGGPASLTTLLCPILLAASGVYVPKVSASGSIAGAIDTLGVIPNFRTQLNREDFEKALRKAGIAHSLQTDKICPADQDLMEVRRQKHAMRNVSLATASLLAKKMAVPGTASMFDFRVGPTGNIGDTKHVGQRAAHFFLDVAYRLDLKAAVALTNACYPCSRFGRLESLELLCDILRGSSDLLPLDGKHRATCIEISAKAASLTQQACSAAAVEESISNGTAWETLCMHAEAQGASEHAILDALSKLRKQSVKEIFVTAAGYWRPPNLNSLKSWFKNEQNRLAGSLADAGSQLGVRLLVSPGDEVAANQPVMQVRVPAAKAVRIDEVLLRGEVIHEPIEIGEQLLEFIGVN